MNTNTDSHIGYTLARLGLGVNFLSHGLVRFPKVSGFAEWMTGAFEKTWLPSPAVSAFAHSLPFIEFGIGILLILGLFTRYALTLGGFLVISLIFGSCLIENWEWVSFQMIYLAFFAILLTHREGSNQFSLDSFRE